MIGMHKTAIAAFISVSLAACSTVRVDDSLGIAQTHAALQQTVGFATVTVPDGSYLRGASLDGHPAFCTLQPAYFIIGENGRGVCLTDTEQTGYFNGYYVLGTIVSMTFETKIPYTLDTKARMVQRFMLDPSYQQQLIQYDYYRNMR